MQNFTGVRDKYVYKDVPEGDVVRVEVYYTKGGANYFSGGATRRGIFLSIRKVKIEKRESGIASESFMMFGGEHEVRFFIAELARKSDKKLAEIAEHFDKFVREYVEQWKSDPAKANADMLAKVKEYRGEVTVAA